MTKHELATNLRAELSDDDVLFLALVCPDCGKPRLGLEHAVALASEVDSLDEWWNLVDAAENVPKASPARSLPPAEVVGPHCRELATRAAKRKGLR
jgi:hypothetical protein